MKWVVGPRPTCSSPAAKATAWWLAGSNTIVWAAAAMPASQQREDPCPLVINDLQLRNEHDSLEVPADPIAMKNLENQQNTQLT